MLSHGYQCNWEEWGGRPVGEGRAAESLSSFKGCCWGGWPARPTPGLCHHHTHTSGLADSIPCWARRTAALKEVGTWKAGLTVRHLLSSWEPWSGLGSWKREASCWHKGTWPLVLTVGFCIQGGKLGRGVLTPKFLDLMPQSSGREKRKLCMLT